MDNDGIQQRGQTSGLRYKSLSTEQKEFYQDLGRRATLAWQHGHTAFGASLHTGNGPAVAKSLGNIEEPNRVLSTGVIVAANVPGGEQLSLVLPESECKFEKTLKQLVKDHKLVSSNLRKKDEENALALCQFSSDVINKVSKTTDIVGLPADNLFADCTQTMHDGCPGTHERVQSDVVTFSPPIIDFVAVTYLGLLSMLIP